MKKKKEKKRKVKQKIYPIKSYLVIPKKKEKEYIPTYINRYKYT